MKTLVIHPQDETTDFLKPIYQSIKANVISGNCSKEEVHWQIQQHDRVIFLGHGSPNGLFAVNQFKNEAIYSFVIDDNTAKLLKGMKNNIYIWCHADQFVKRHQLNGFYTGMFISEETEAYLFNIHPMENEVSTSNELFSRLVGSYINKSSRQLHNIINENYKIVNSSICDFNRCRANWS